jgi:hypothetical protein
MRKELLILLALFLIVRPAHSQTPENPFVWDQVSDVSGGPVAYGNGQFIAFGYSSSLYANGTFSSPTGEPGSWTWTGYGLQFGTPWAVAYGNGLFVAADYDGIETSPDGANWTTVYSETNSAESSLSAIIYAHGLFVAVGGSPEDEGPGPTIILTSSDGTHWTRRGPNLSGELESVAYGNGVFMTVGLEWFTLAGGADEGYADLTSTDGINWASHPDAEAPVLNGIAFGNGLFAVLAGNGILTTANGTLSLKAPYVSSDNFTSVAYGDGWFVSVGDSIIVSSNGRAWSSSSYNLPSTASFSSVAFLNGVFMAASDSGILRGRLNVPPQHAPPTILTAPEYQVVNAGESASFSVTASGSSPLSFQWQFNGANLPGQTNSTLSIPYALPASAGSYTVVVINPYGSVTSAPPAVLDVQYPDYPTILTEPAATRSVQVGGTVEFNVLALGDAPLTYQWQMNGSNMAGATSSALILSDVTELQDGYYVAAVSNNEGSAYSDEIFLTVSTLPQTVSTEYWPMYDGDVKYYSGVAGSCAIQSTLDANGGGFLVRIFLGDTNGSPADTFGMSYDAASETVYNYSAKPEIGATFDFDPAWTWFDDHQLQNGGTLSSSFVASVPNYTNINSSGLVTVKQGGTVKVPAGTFSDCRIISTAGSGVILGALNQSMVLAPSVGPIEIGLYLPTPSGGTRFVGWESLTGGTVGGVEVMKLAARDVTPPTVTITTPTPKESVLNPVFAVTGKASDNVAVAQVYVQLNGGTWTPATLGDSGGTWSSSVSLTPGANTVSAYAVDATGNVSPTKSVTFTYILSAVLSVQISGLGSVSPHGSSEVLQVDKSYTLTAASARNWLFSNWVASGTQNFVSNNPVLHLTMRSDLLLTANFVTNVFLAAQGTYIGLFAPTSLPREQPNSGAFTLTVTSTGHMSGTLTIGKTMSSVAGQFDLSGAITLITSRKGLTTLTTTLQLNFAEQSVKGTVGDGSFLASLTGHKEVFSSSHTAAGYEGRYTLVIPGTNDPAVGPYGSSYGTVTISASGGITFGGSLADGTAVNQTSSVSKDGYWPLYLSLYNGYGSLWGWNYFSNGIIVSLPNFSWINATNSSKTALYRSGFTNQGVSVNGSLYAASQALPVDMNVILGGGNLPLVITNGVICNVNDKITLTNSLDETNKLTLTVNKTTGVISGSFANPSNPKQTIKVNGVIEKGQAIAQGFFLGTNQSGVFLLQNR